MPLLDKAEIDRGIDLAENCPIFVPEDDAQPVKMMLMQCSPELYHWLELHLFELLVTAKFSLKKSFAEDPK